MIASSRTLPGLLSMVLFAVGAGAFGCGGSSPEASTPEEATAAPGVPPAPRPKDAARRAEAAVDGKVGALIWVDRVRGNPAGQRVLKWPVVADMLAGTGLDPLKDLERVFVSSPGANQPRGILFAEHNLDSEHARQALESVLKKSDPPGQRRQDLQPYDAVQVTIKGRTGIVALLPPRYLVVVPEDLASHISDFEGTGGLADPTGPEAAVAVAVDPSQSLRAPRVPRIPDTISRLTARVTLNPDGGISTDVVGDSSSPEQAVDDAQKLTSEIDRATSVKVAFVTVRFIDPIVVKPEGTQVKAHLDLTKQQVDSGLDMAQRFLPN